MTISISISISIDYQTKSCDEYIVTPVSRLIFVSFSLAVVNKLNPTHFDITSSEDLITCECLKGTAA